MLAPDAATTRWLALLALFTMAGGLACASGMPFSRGDDDGVPGAAVPIALGERLEGTLDCRKGGGPDCTDWYRLRPQTPGRLGISVTAGETTDAASVAVDLADENGEILSSAEASGPGGARVTHRVTEPVAFLAAVRTSPSAGAVSYVLEPSLSTAPERPPTRTTRSTVLEVEPGEGGVSVLLDAGLAQEMRTGYRGRLVEGGQAIGHILIIEVFEEGSRARVEGALGGSITADTVAEIEVPTAP